MSVGKVPQDIFIQSEQSVFGLRLHLQVTTFERIFEFVNDNCVFLVILLGLTLATLAAITAIINTNSLNSEEYHSNFPQPGINQDNPNQKASQPSTTTQKATGEMPNKTREAALKNLMIQQAKQFSNCSLKLTNRIQINLFQKYKKHSRRF